MQTSRLREIYSTNKERIVMQISEKRVLYFSFIISISFHLLIFSVIYFLSYKPKTPEKEKIITISLDSSMIEKPSIDQEKKEIKPITEEKVVKYQKPPEKKETSVQEKVAKEEIPQVSPPSQQPPPSMEQKIQTPPEQPAQKIDLSQGRPDQFKTPPKKEEDINGYLKELIRYLNQQARERDLYPPIAKRLKIEGEVIVRVTINEDGTIEENSISIIEASGYNILDRGAIDILKKLQPYKKPPKKITVEIPIVFQIIYM